MSKKKNPSQMFRALAARGARNKRCCLWTPLYMYPVTSSSTAEATPRINEHNYPRIVYQTPTFRQSNTKANYNLLKCCQPRFANYIRLFVELVSFTTWRGGAVKNAAGTMEGKRGE
jgi:hypothetical protein